MANIQWFVASGPLQRPAHTPSYGWTPKRHAAGPTSHLQTSYEAQYFSGSFFGWFLGYFCLFVIFIFILFCAAPIPSECCVLVGLQTVQQTDWQADVECRKPPWQIQHKIDSKLINYPYLRQKLWCVDKRMFSQTSEYRFLSNFTTFSNLCIGKIPPSAFPPQTKQEISFQQPRRDWTGRLQIIVCWTEDEPDSNTQCSLGKTRKGEKGNFRLWSFLPPVLLLLSTFICIDSRDHLIGKGDECVECSRAARPADLTVRSLERLPF